MVPRTVLTRSGPISLNTARPVNTVQPRTAVNNAGPIKNVINNVYSTARRPFNKITTTNNSNFTKKVNTVKGTRVNTARPKAVLSAVKGNKGNAVKASACWVWRPKHKVLDHIDEEKLMESLLPLEHLTNSMNYKPVVIGNQSNGNIGTKACDNVGKARMETGMEKKLDTKDSMEMKEALGKIATKFNLLNQKQSIELPNDLNMPELEEIVYSDDDEDVGAEAEINNLDAIITKQDWLLKGTQKKKELTMMKFLPLLPELKQLGFEDPDFPDRVYKVEKALYGLHQAPRAWYKTLSTYLLEIGCLEWNEKATKDEIGVSTCNLKVSADKYN
ncbi:putative ribonuclease H-like domain-containing protein [Tanacetum coccineum]